MDIGSGGEVVYGVEYCMFDYFGGVYVGCVVCFFCELYGQDVFGFVYVCGGVCSVDDC